MLAAYVIAIDRRRVRARQVLSDLKRALEADDVRALPLEARVDRIRPVLDRASRELVMQAAADADTPPTLFEAITAYLFERCGIESLVRDASSHRSARDKWRRTAALRILSQWHHPGILPLLQRAVADTDSDVAMTAFALLGASPDPAAADILIAALTEQKHPASRVAVHLEQLNQPLAAKLRPLLHAPNPTVRFWAATLLAPFVDTPGLEQDLADRADDPDPRVRKAVLETLGKIGDDIAARVATERLTDPVPFVRAHAARALGRLERVERAPEVAVLLGDVDWWVRLAAKEALEAMGAEVWPVLYRCLEHRDRFVRNGAAEVFQNLGILDSLVLMEAASDRPGQDKIAMLRRIAAAGGVRLADSLVERVGPVVGARVRQILDTIGMQRVGAA